MLNIENIIKINEWDLISCYRFGLLSNMICNLSGYNYELSYEIITKLLKILLNINFFDLESLDDDYVESVMCVICKEYINIIDSKNNSFDYSKCVKGDKYDEIRDNLRILSLFNESIRNLSYLLTDGKSVYDYIEDFYLYLHPDSKIFNDFYDIFFATFEAEQLNFICRQEDEGWDEGWDEIMSTVFIYTISIFIHLNYNFDLELCKNTSYSIMLINTLPKYVDNSLFDFFENIILNPKILRSIVKGDLKEYNEYMQGLRQYTWSLDNLESLINISQRNPNFQFKEPLFYIIPQIVNILNKNNKYINIDDVDDYIGLFIDTELHNYPENVQNIIIDYIEKNKW